MFKSIGRYHKTVLCNHNRKYSVEKLKMSFKVLVLNGQLCSPECSCLFNLDWLCIYFKYSRCILIVNCYPSRKWSHTLYTSPQVFAKSITSSTYNKSIMTTLQMTTSSTLSRTYQPWTTTEHG